MRPAIQILLAVVLLIIGGAVGYFIGAGKADPETARAMSVSGAQSGIAAGETATPGAKPRGDEDPAARRNRILQALFTSRNFWGRAVAAADELTLDDIPQALELAQKNRDRHGQPVLGLILERWVDFDPQAAANYALTMKVHGLGERIGAASAVGKAWAKRDRQAAQTWATGIVEPGVRMNALTGMATAILEQNPGAAFGWLQGLPTKMATAEIYNTVFEGWAASDPLAASQQAMAVSGKQRGTALQAVATTWSQKDPEAAFAWVQQIPGSSGRFGVLHSVVANWAQRDPSAALAAVAKLPDGTLRSENYRNILSATVSLDLALAFKLAEQIPEGPERTAALQAPHFQLAIQNPKAGVDLALTEYTGQQQSELLSYAIQRWAQEAPVAALEYLAKRLPEGGQRKEAEQRALSSWAQAEPEAAIDWMLANGRTTPGDLDSAVDVWANRDPEALLAWAHALPAGALRDQAASAAIPTLARENPLRAAEEIAQLPEGGPKRSASERLANDWASHDPAATAKWVAQIADDETRVKASRNVARAWSGRDYPQATAWLETLPAGAVRDAAIQGYSQTAVHIDPAKTAAWGESIGDPDNRERTLKKIYEAWAYTNAPAANRWLENSKAVDPKTAGQWRK